MIGGKTILVLGYGEVRSPSITLHHFYLCRLARGVVLLLRGWEESALLQKLIQFVLYKLGEISEVFTVSLIDTIAWTASK